MHRHTHQQLPWEARTPDPMTSSCGLASTLASATLYSSFVWYLLNILQKAKPHCCCFLLTHRSITSEITVKVLLNGPEETSRMQLWLSTSVEFLMTEYPLAPPHKPHPCAFQLCFNPIPCHILHHSMLPAKRGLCSHTPSIGPVISILRAITQPLSPEIQLYLRLLRRHLYHS